MTKIVKRSKARLLARASTVAIIAAAGQFGVVAQAQAQPACLNVTSSTTIANGNDQTCVEVVDNSVGFVTNDAEIGANGGDASFFVGGEGSITGELLNTNTIKGGGSRFGALTIGDGASVGSIRNTGNIGSVSGNAINIGYSTSVYDYPSAGSVAGNITNTGVISGLGGHGIAALYGTMGGQLVNGNKGVISGADVGVFIADSFTSWDGGILNDGQILGDEAGIQVGSLYGTGTGDVDFSGGIDNNGTISSLGGPSIIAGGNSFSGGIDNSGVITQRSLSAAGGEGSYAGVGIAVSAETFNGDIQNTGQVLGLGGPAIWVTSENATFNGSIRNYNYIDASGDYDATGILIRSNVFNGNIENYWYIHGSESGVVMDAGSFHGNVTNTGNILGDNGGGLIIEADVIDGGEGVASEIRNQNLVRGRMTGLGIYGEDVHANLTNERQNYIGSPLAIIEGTSGVGVAIGVVNWTGDITNSGTIIGSAPEFDVLAPPTNASLIEGGGGTGLYVDASTFSGSITNSGLIHGDATGIDIYIEPQYYGEECWYECYSGGSFTGSITNSGTITGGDVGLEIDSGIIEDDSTFAGTITNEGWIDGGNDGARISVGIYDGDFINDGTITGYYSALEMNVGEFTGNFVNNGTIHGQVDGANIVAGTISGNITNNGTIIGESMDTALYVSAGSMTGNVVNNNYLSASANALHVNIGTLTGQVINTGLIESTSGGTAALLNVGNGTTFRNASGGAIDGDVVFNGLGAYVYSAGDGSIDGSLLGQTGVIGGNPVNNDTIVVDGEHSFIDGSAVNFASFSVNNGGVALMGATSMGGSSASPYAFSNVDVLNVNNGGTLYVDRGTTLAVDDSYTQQSGGTLMFYLQAPGGSGFTGLTGTQTAASTDVGHIVVDGPVTLSGTIAGFLDPAFASANSALDEVIYNDVIVSTGTNAQIIGDFTATALVSNNALFQLFDLIDGNTVDLRVSRSPVSQGPSTSALVGLTDPFDSQTADRMNGIGSGSCGLAGPGWCFNRFAANEPGATQVMTDASPGEDPFAWLRTGVRRVGETAVWGRAVGVWGDTDGEAAAGIPGTDFKLTGGIAGIDHVFTQTLLAGVAAQWTTTSVDFDGRRDNADVDSIELGAYASWGDTRLYLNANASYIWHDFEVTRFTGGTFARGDYSGDTISAYAEGGKIFETESGFRIQPIVALSYAHLSTDAYSEKGTALQLLNVFDADYDSLKSVMGTRFAYPMQMSSGRRWVPEARLAWTHEFMDERASHFVDIQGGPVVPQLVNGETIARDSLVLGTGLTVPFADNATAFVDYDAGLNSDVTTHTLSGGVRVRW